MGRPLPASAPMVSTEMIPGRREFYDSLGVPEVDFQLARMVERVVLRNEDSVRLEGEIYVPSGRGPFPGMVYLHGGAFSIWNARTVRRQAMRLAAGGRIVLSVDHRLAPEHPFPAAVEDAVFAARWFTAFGGRFGVAPGAIAVGGDSSGANLAAAAISYLAAPSGVIDEGDLRGTPVEFSAGLFLYGIFDLGARMRERPSAPGTTEIMLNLAYLGPHFLAQHSNPLVSPILATNLGSFPPVYLSCGDQDSTLPQSLAMTAALARVDVSTTLSVVEGGDHEFLMLSEAQLPGVDEEWSRIDRWLDGATGRSSRKLDPAS